jgi:hypothetical protein
MRTTRRRFFRGLAATLAAGLLPESAILAGEAPVATQRAVRLADLAADDRARVAEAFAQGFYREFARLPMADPPAC